MRLTPSYQVRHLAGERIGRRLRAITVTVVALVALLAATVAFAQSSLGYDLACRSVLDSGGGLLRAPSGVYGLVGAAGQSPAGESRSPNYGVRGGYVQPDAPPTVAAGATIAAGDQLSRTLLPIIGKVVRVVRGGC